MRHCEVGRVAENNKQRVRETEVTFTQTKDKHRTRWHRPIDNIHETQASATTRADTVTKEDKGIKDLFRPSHPH